MFNVGLIYRASLCFCLILISMLLTSWENLEYDDKDFEQLGRKLFYDTQLSYSNKISCSHCHEPTLAFTDGYRISHNEKAILLHKNSPTLLNIDQRLHFNWSSKSITSLSEQIKGPLFNNHPDEMGFYRDTAIIMKRLDHDPVYETDLKNLKHKTFDRYLIISALSAYIKKLTSRNSKYDHFKSSQDSTIFTNKEWQGYKVFMSEEAKCNFCHGGQDFFTPKFGVEFITEKKGVDIRVPTLRNVAITAPYFHDGREDSLLKAIQEHITITSEKDPRYHAIHLEDAKIKTIISFLHTLTDTTYLTNPYFNNPFIAKNRS